jgi:pSer/pThr/pTyr-binding forkhead associated (FHA) protein
VVATAHYLRDYVRELGELGERAFRQRHRASVLIVAGRVTRRHRRDTGAKTLADRPTLHGLLDRVFPLTKGRGAPSGPVVVGRAEEGDVDVTIPEASISKRHCAFAALDGAATITDCGSRNGTTVNGTAVAPQRAVPLAGGETIGLGRLQLTFETPAGFAELVGTLHR